MSEVTAARSSLRLWRVTAAATAGLHARGAPPGRNAAAAAVGGNVAAPPMDPHYSSDVAQANSVLERALENELWLMALASCCCLSR